MKDNAGDAAWSTAPRSTFLRLGPQIAFPSLAGRDPSGNGLAQSFQQPFEFGLTMLQPSHAIAQLFDVVSQP